MRKDYRTVYQGGEGEIVEKKSRFIATVLPVKREEEALSFVEAMKKKYWDARHNCFAYIIGERGELERCSDDGEPSGTAGKPMLDVLRGEELCNVAVVVTRYFGGTLLGTGGLVRAYSAAVKAGLSTSVIITKVCGIKLEILADYTELGKIQYLLSEQGISVLDSIYTDKVSLEVLVPVPEVERIKAELIEGTNGRIQMTDKEHCYYAEIDGKAKVLTE